MKNCIQKNLLIGSLSILFSTSSLLAIGATKATASAKAPSTTSSGSEIWAKDGMNESRVDTEMTEAEVEESSAQLKTTVDQFQSSEKEYNQLSEGFKNQANLNRSKTKENTKTQHGLEKKIALFKVELDRLEKENKDLDLQLKKSETIVQTREATKTDLQTKRDQSKSRKDENVSKSLELSAKIESLKKDIEKAKTEKSKALADEKLSLEKMKVTQKKLSTVQSVAAKSLKEDQTSIKNSELRTQKYEKYTLAASAQIEKLKEQQKIKEGQLKQQREKEKAALEKANLTSKNLAQLKGKKIGSFNHMP